MCFEQHLNTAWRFLGCKMHLNLHLHSHQYCWPFQGGGSDVTCMYFCMAQRVSSCLCLACYIIMFVQLAWALWSPSGGGEGRGVERAASGCLSFSLFLNIYNVCHYSVFLFFLVPLKGFDFSLWLFLNISFMSHIMRKPVYAICYVNNKGADQPAHPRSLFSAFVVRWLDSMIFLVSISEISSL